MSKRRKVDNLLGLAVLSTVVAEPMHPYEIASLLRARGKDADMPIRWGSLYTVVRNLARHGFLEVVGNTRAGARPERTVYRITDAGRAELADWVRELVGELTPELPRFKAGLSVLAVLPPDEVSTLLRARLALLRKRIDAHRAELAGFAKEIPRLFLVEAEYDLAMREAEAAWIAALLEELADGSFPSLELWREYHRTGRVPREIAELAERGRHDEHE